MASLSRTGTIVVAFVLQNASIAGTAAVPFTDLTSISARTTVDAKSFGELSLQCRTNYALLSQAVTPGRPESMVLLGQQPLLVNGTAPIIDGVYAEPTGVRVTAYNNFDATQTLDVQVLCGKFDAEYRRRAGRRRSQHHIEAVRPRHRQLPAGILRHWRRLPRHDRRDHRPTRPLAERAAVGTTPRWPAGRCGERVGGRSRQSRHHGPALPGLCVLPQAALPFSPGTCGHAPARAARTALPWRHLAEFPLRIDRRNVRQRRGTPFGRRHLASGQAAFRATRIQLQRSARRIPAGSRRHHWKFRS